MFRIEFEVDDATFRHAQRGNVAALRAAVQHAPYPPAAAAGKYKAWLALLLRVAAVNDWPDAVRFLLDAAATPDAVNFHHRHTPACYRRPLEYAAAAGSTLAVTVLLAAKADTGTWRDAGHPKNALMCAARERQLRSVRTLLAFKAEVHWIELKEAATCPGNVAVVRAFLAQVVGTRGSLGHYYDAAHLLADAAKVRRNAGVVRLLLNAKASPNYGEALRSAAGLACGHGFGYPFFPRIATLRLLLWAGADLYLQRHKDLFVDASKYTLVPVVRAMLDAGADVNASSQQFGRNHQTALHAAIGHAGCSCGKPITEENTATRVALMNLLIAHKADLQARDCARRTPLTLAATGEYCEQSEFSCTEWSPAMEAFNKTHRDAVVLCLVRAKAVVDPRASDHVQYRVRDAVERAGIRAGIRRAI